MTNIWFNRWFSVAYHYMNMIRNNPDQEAFRCYGTHPDIRHMSLQGCDHAETEPALEGEAYVEFCLEFCRRHDIDVFIPRLHMFDIAKHVHKFDEIGTKVMVCRDLELLKSLIDKDKFYASIEGKGIVEIPDYRVARTAEQFKNAYEELTAKGHRVCFKPTQAEGGMGFRIIAEQRDPLQEIYSWVTLKTTFEQAYQTFASVESFEDIMVMELLEGDEYSIDCLANSEGKLLTAIPRRKSSGRVYLLEEIPELLEIAERIASSCRIPYAFNIQVKYNHGIPKLLEINPRMSGGLYITCLSGVNLPYYAVKSVMGQPFDMPLPQFGIAASYVEQPIVLSRETDSTL